MEDDSDNWTWRSQTCEGCNTRMTSVAYGHALYMCLEPDCKEFGVELTQVVEHQKDYEMWKQSKEDGSN